MGGNDVVAVEFTDEEQHLLIWGMQVWHGASSPPPAMRRALGFDTYEEIYPWTNEKMNAVGPVMKMSRADWTQLISLVEVGFASDNAGAGLEWFAVSGIPDGQSIRILRQIQGKLRRVVLRYQKRSGEPNPGSE